MSQIINTITVKMNAHRDNTPQIIIHNDRVEYIQNVVIMCETCLFIFSTTIQIKGSIHKNCFQIRSMQAAWLIDQGTLLPVISLPGHQSLILISYVRMCDANTNNSQIEKFINDIKVTDIICYKFLKESLDSASVVQLFPHLISERLCLKWQAKTKLDHGVPGPGEISLTTYGTF